MFTAYDEDSITFPCGLAACVNRPTKKWGVCTLEWSKTGSDDDFKVAASLKFRKVVAGFDLNGKEVHDNLCLGIHSLGIYC